ncbi:MAG: transposase [Proteobacteria bacterium]|nr:transposase [Pseudomonadota bacterium]
MAKSRRYKQVHVNTVDVMTLVELGPDIQVGFDVAKTNQVASFQDRESGRGLIVRWEHPQETFAFFDLCLGVRARRGVEIVMEPSGTYGDPFLHWFHTNNFKVWRVLGAQVHAGAAAIDGVRSGHDAKSARLMVAIHKLEGSSEWLAREEATRDLRALVGMHAWHDDQARRLVGMAEGALARSWPELTRLFKPRSKIYWRLLAHFGGPDAVAADPDEAAAYMRRTGRNFLKSEKITAVLTSAEATLGVPMSEAERRHLKLIGSEYLRVLEARTELADELDTKVRDMARPQLVGLLGATTTATLFAYNLDPLRFDNPRAFVKALGLNLKVRSSGKQKGRLRITKRGAPKPRMLLVLAAGRLIQRDPVVKAWHMAKRARDGGKGKGMISLIAITRKLATAVWHVARGNEFDARKLFDVDRLARRNPALYAAAEAPSDEADRDDEILDAHTETLLDQSLLDNPADDGSVHHEQLDAEEPPDPSNTNPDGHVQQPPLTPPDLPGPIQLLVDKLSDDHHP